MGVGLRLTAAVILFALVPGHLAGAQAPAATASYAVTTSETDATATDLAPTIPSAATGFTSTLYLYWTGSGAPSATTTVSLQAFVDAGTATIVAGSEDWTMSAAHPTPFLLKVTGLTDEATVTGVIALTEHIEHPGQASTAESFTVGHFTATRAPATVGVSDLVIVGGDAGLTVGTSTSSATLRVRVTNKGHATAKVVVSPSGLIGPADTPLSAPEPLTGDVAAGATAEFPFSFGPLTVAGDYTGFVDMSVDGAPAPSVTLKVTRTTDALSVSTDPGATTRIDVKGKATVAFDVTNNGPLPVTLKIEVANTTREADKTTNNVSVTAVEGQASQVEVAAGKPTHVALQLQGFDQPGRYTVHVHLTGTDQTGSQTVDLVVAVKRSRAAAIWWFGIGAFGIGGLVYWLQRRRVRAANELALAKLKEVVDHLPFPDQPTPDMLAIRNGLGVRAGTVEGLVGDDSFKDAAALYGFQVQLGRALLDLLVRQHAAGLDKRHDIGDLLALLTSETVAAPDQEAALKRVRALIARVPVEGRLLTMRTAVEKWKVSVAPAADDVKLITDKLDSAEHEAADDKVDDAWKDLLAAEATWRESLAGSLEHLATRPVWTTDPWSTRPAVKRAVALMESLRVDTDRDAIERWLDVDHRLDDLVETRATALVAHLAPADREAATALAASKESFHERRDALAALEARVQQRTNPQLVADFRTEYLLAELAHAGRPSARVGAPSSADASSGPSHTVPTLRTAGRRWRLITVATLVVTGFVAILLAILTVYEPSETWGTASDIIAALLWGIGLTSATSFTGLATMQHTLFPDAPA